MVKNNINLIQLIIRYQIVQLGQTLSTQQKMRQKIRFDLLLRSQKLAQSSRHPIQTALYQNAYKYIKGVKQSIVKPFSNICIHGNFPELIIPALIQDNNSNYNFWVHSQMSNQDFSKSNNVHLLNNQVPFNTIKHQTTYDLIVSCLEGHHYEPQNLLEVYNKNLNPDGAILGCCWAQNTLKELKWSYMMAQNQRNGGISPKVLNFPSLGNIGHFLTTAKIKLPTIIVRDLEIQVDSMVDILTLLQVMGESGSLHGRRKGVYKDLLLAAAAYYDSEFNEELQNKQKVVNFSLELGIFIGWKQHESQPKPLNRGKIINRSFFQQLMSEDKESKMYTISQQSQEPVQVNIKDKQNQKQKDPKA